MRGRESPARVAATKPVILPRGAGSPSRRQPDVRSVACAACALHGKRGGKGGQAVFVDGGPQGGRERKVIMEVVDRVEAGPQDLVDPLQVMEIGAREMAARVARAGHIERSRVRTMH